MVEESIMKTFTCQFVQNRMPAFINNECSVRERRLIGQHLDECAACDAVYRQQRRAQREMQSELPRLGMPDQGRLALIWERVEQELATPPQRVPSKVAPRISWHYGLVAVLAVFMLAVPWVMDSNPVHASVPSQPAPVEMTELEQATPEHEQTLPPVTEVAYATHPEVTTGPVQSVLHNTPPQTPSPASTRPE